MKYKKYSVYEVNKKSIKFDASTTLKTIEIKKGMGWCDDVNFEKKYNKPIKINKKIGHEKLRRKDHKYNLLIPIKYNFLKPIVGLGSCVFIHLTSNYKPTAGCIALKKKDFLIMLKLIKKKKKIKIKKKKNKKQKIKKKI